MAKYLQFSWAIILLLSLNAAADFSPISEQRLIELNGAIFDTFTPFFEEEYDTTIKHLVASAKSKSLELIKTLPTIRYAFLLLDNLHLLHNRFILKSYYRFMAKDRADELTVTKKALRPLRQFLKNLPNDHVKLSILDLSIDQRLRLFTELIQSDVNLLRMLGFSLRVFYINAIYEGALGQKISGLAAKALEAPIMPSLPAFKTNVRYNEHKHRLEGRFDAVIVGSGPSGAVAAHEFQRSGLKVLVVESGPMVIPGAINTIVDLRFMVGQKPLLSEDGSIALINGGAVGGGTTVNLDMSFPPTLPFVRHRFHQWHEEGLIPQSLWKDKEIDRAFKWVDSIFEPRTIGWDEINENNTILMNGAEALGIPFKRYQLNHYPPNESPHAVYDKKSSFEKLLLPAMLASVNPATLLSDCRVTKVLIKHKKAYGVECIYDPKHAGLGIVHDIYGLAIKPKTKIRIYADNVILAAGNLGTSALLLKSKINNKNIGRGFVAHPFVSLMGRFDREIRPDIGEPSTIFIDQFMQTDEHPERPGYLIEAGVGKINLWSLLIPGLPRQVHDNFRTIDHVGGFSIMVTDTPNDQNRVELGHNGKVKMHYHLSDNDKEKIIEGIKTSTKILFAAGALEVSFNSFEHPLFQSSNIRSNTLTPDMDLDEVFSKFKVVRNQTSLVGAHMMGGNKIGMSPDRSVVNQDYQVWGVNSLYVIDSSIFPSSVGANPMQTIYTCAKIFADRFLGKSLYAGKAARIVK